jgi:photosystem II stability/assembly factor-like uncharacterized protein
LRAGWAVGKNGTVITTKDNDDSWTLQRSSANEELTGVAIANDGQQGWAVTYTGSILSTEDGGKSWTPKKTTSDELKGIAFAGSHVWAVGIRRAPLLDFSSPPDRGIIWTISNDGKDWTPTFWPHPLTSVAVSADGQVAWAVGGSGTILTTTNGGNWSPQNVGTTEDLYSVTFDPDGHGLAVGDHGTILAVRKGGLKWEAKDRGLTPFRLRGVAFAKDRRHAWVVGDNGTILESADSGDSWRAKSGHITRALSGVAATRGRVWVFAEDRGPVSTSVDYGENWVDQPRANSASLKAIAVASNASGDTQPKPWAVGVEGTVLIPVEEPLFGPVESKKSGSNITTSFQLQNGDPLMPIWSAYLCASKSPGVDCDVSSSVGEFTSETGKDWKIRWDPDEHGFQSVADIYPQIAVYAGVTKVAPKQGIPLIPWET